MSEPFNTYHVSRIVNLPPLVAQAAFDAQFASEDAGRCVTVVGSCRLELVRRTCLPQTCVPGAHPGAVPFRAVPGTLYAGLRRTHVDLELWAWSSRKVELGLQPRLRGRRRLSERMVSAGHSVLAHVETSLYAWADVPLSRLAGHSARPVRRSRRRLTPPPASGRTPA